MGGGGGISQWDMHITALRSQVLRCHKNELLTVASCFQHVMVGVLCFAGVLQIAGSEMEPAEDGVGIKVHVHTDTVLVVRTTLKASVCSGNTFLGLATISSCIVLSPVAWLAHG